MKNIIIVLGLICCSNQLFSEVSDSSNLDQNNVRRNEFGLSVNNMDNLISTNFNIANSITLGYKRRFENYALRLNFYYYEKDNYGLFNDYTKLNDSTFILTSYSYNSFYSGAKIGFERDYSINKNVKLFYGIDFFYTHIKEKQSNASAYYKTNTKEVINFGFSDSNVPNGTFYGYEIGIDPIIGIEQYFEPYFSATVELNFLAYYSKIQSQSYSTLLNEKVKLIVNYNF